MPRYLCIYNRDTDRWTVRDTQSGRFCPTIAAGMTRAQAEQYAERLNSRAEMFQTMREVAEACS